MNKSLRLFLLTLLLCGFMQTMADTWTDSNGLTWFFTVNGTEATDLRFYSGPDSKKIYLYGDPNRSEEEIAADPQLPFVPGAWDAAAMRFSYSEGKHLPTIPDDVYFSLKTLIFDVSDVTANFDMKVMNGWWSNTYYDHVKWENGLNELQITPTMADECAKGGGSRDLVLMLYNGSMTLNAVYYESSEVSGDIVIPSKVYDGSKELTVTSIGYGAFYDCHGLTSVTIPESVTSIGKRAFQYCMRLTSVNIPSSVTYIGDAAFYECLSLKSVNIPSSLTYIGDGAFKYCGGLTSITVDSGNMIYDSRDNCNAIIATASNTLIVGSNTTVIPNSVTSIGDYAFGECRGLTSIEIPNRVTIIGSYAFTGCMGLTSIEIPNSVTSIGACAFYNCSGLTSITIPSSVTCIGSGAFQYTGWYNKQSDGIIYLDNWLLGYKGNAPTGELVINEGTKRMADYSFYYCSDLTSIIIPNSVMSISNSAFYWCSSLTSVTIGNSVTSIGNWAFSRCPNLTSIVIPGSVTSIGDWAFYDCTGLTSVNIPSSVTNIGDWAFYDCTGLTSVTIPESVTNIGNSAFYGCTSLTAVTSLIKEPFEITEDVFGHYDTSGNFVFTSATLYVPAGTKSLYEATPAWNQFNKIEEMGESEGVQSPVDHLPSTIGNYFMLDGRKIEGIPAKKGLYILNGRKVLVGDKR